MVIPSVELRKTMFHTFLHLPGVSRILHSSLFIFESLLCCVADTTEVAYALGYAHEGVAHVLFVLEADTAGIVVLAQQADEEGEVDTTTAQLNALVGLGGAGDILQVDIEDAGVVLLIV